MGTSTPPAYERPHALRARETRRPQVVPARDRPRPDPRADRDVAVFIPKHYLVALALVGAVVVGFFSHLITDQLGGGRPGGRDATQPAAVVAKPVSTGPSVVVPSDPPSAPNPPIVSQPGGGGSTTNIYLTIVNTPGGTSASPPTINVAPNP